MEEKTDRKTPLDRSSGVLMVEAAGQLIHLFRDGLDYAFILQTQDAGRVIRDRTLSRILVPARCADDR